MSQKISAVVQTYNAEKYLERVLTALQGFDEVLVVDMESTDSTPDIARRCGARVITVPHGPESICEAYRDYAVHAAEHPWVLIVDADEIVTPALREYLYAEIERDPTPRAFLLPRKNYMFGRWMRSLYPDYNVRFFRREGTRWPSTIHSRPSHEGQAVRIPRRRTDLALEHLARETVAQQVDKMNRYTDSEARRRSKRFRSHQLLTGPAWRFIKAYFLDGAWRDGIPGFIRAVNAAYYRFTALAKIYEQRHLPR